MKKPFRYPLKKIKIESKWEEITLSEILDTLESGKRPKGGVGEYNEGIPSFGGEHIGLNGHIQATQDKLKYVPNDYFENKKQGIINDHDILMCKDGALTGKIALFKFEEVNFSKAMINEHVFYYAVILVVFKHIFLTFFTLRKGKRH